MHGTAPRRPLDAAEGPDERDCSAEPWRGPDGSHRRDWSTGSRPTHTCSQVVPKLIEGALEGTSSEVPPGEPHGLTSSPDAVGPRIEGSTRFHPGCCSRDQG